MSADGTWNITMNTPMGPQTATLTLKSNGDSLEGTVSGPQGSLDIEEGKVDGDTLTWAINMTQPMAMRLDAKATVDGDKLTGEVDLGSFGKATMEGTRA